MEASDDPNADLIGYGFTDDKGVRWAVVGSWMLPSYLILKNEDGETRIIGTAVVRNRKALGD